MSYLAIYSGSWGKAECPDDAFTNALKERMFETEIGDEFKLIEFDCSAKDIVIVDFGYEAPNGAKQAEHTIAIDEDLYRRIENQSAEWDNYILAQDEVAEVIYSKLGL